MLYQDDDASSAHTFFMDGPLLFRAGGYWSDGTTWYRPGQIWDAASEEYVRRTVPAAATVTAADLLGGQDADPARGTVREIGEIDPDTPFSGRWLDELALWADIRGRDRLRDSVVTLTAPELGADQLIGAPEVAEITGIAASTLRAYIARGEASVPEPQATISGRPMWSRPVAQDWAEKRQRSPEGVIAAVSTASGGRESVPVGEAETAAGLARSFFATLWEYRPFRSRWALRWRNANAVREVADILGGDTAGYMLDSLIPISDLATTIEHAVLDELAEGQRNQRAIAEHQKGLRVAGPDETSEDHVSYGITLPVARMLGWLVRHRPEYAGHAIGSLTGEAERRFGIPRHVTEFSLKIALGVDGNLGAEALNNFLDRVLTPDSDS
jgi:hypothetical protein